MLSAPVVAMLDQMPWASIETASAAASPGSLALAQWGAVYRAQLYRSMPAVAVMVAVEVSSSHSVWLTVSRRQPVATGPRRAAAPLQPFRAAWNAPPARRGRASTDRHLGRNAALKTLPGTA